MSCINVAYSGSAKIIFGKFKDVTIMAQEFALPDVRVIYPRVQGPIASTPMSPTGIQYEPLVVQFMIGENFSGYKTIIEWLQNSRTMKHGDVFSDASITLLTTSKVPFQTITFSNVIPTSCSRIQFDVALPEQQPLKAIATFDYTDFKFE